MICGAKLARLNSPIELLSDLGKVRLAHASAERRRHNRAFALDRRTLEEVIAGIGHGHLGGFVGTVGVLLALLPRLGNHSIRLVAVLRGKLPMLPQNLFRRLQLLGIPRPVRGDLRRCRSVKAAGA
jgi:hypothetical protein